MKRNSRWGLALFPFALTALLVATGCGRHDHGHHDAAADPHGGAHDAITSEASTQPADPEAIAAKLVAADLLDGKADQVVTKCAGCALRMDGSHEHALAVNGYSMQFCSSHCREEFAKDTEAKVIALAVPKS